VLALHGTTLTTFITGANTCDLADGMCKLAYNCTTCPPPDPCLTAGLCDDSNECTIDTCIPDAQPTGIRFVILYCIVLLFIVYCISYFGVVL